MTKEASKDCFNEARNKPKLLIIGHARHGKDTFAALVVEKMSLSFVSSSEFVGRRAIWPVWGKERYAAFSDMFEDRTNFRSTWFNLIAAYNTPDKSRTGTEMMKDHDVYVGMRSLDEFHACIDKDLFDYVIWVDGSSRHPPEPKSSNEMHHDLADIHIDNNGPESNLYIAVDNLQQRLHEEGYDVNFVEPMEMYTLEEVEPGLYSKEMEKPWHEDPCDPPIQKPLIINDNKPTLKEYTGMINPPMVPDQGALSPKDWNDMSDGEMRCNGDCGCEDGSLCHENVCGPISKMTVNLTLDEERRAHNEAIMRACNPVRYTGGAAPAKPFRIIPESEKWTDASDRPPLNWKDQPENATQVLDHGFFKVIGVMGTDQAIVDAARMSYGRGTKPTSNSAGLINYLVRNHHTSPLEMAEIKFHIRMPIFVMRQWVRHRTANLNEYSGRYSEMVRLFYIPNLEQICLQDKVNKQGSAQPMAGQNAMSVVDDMFEVCDSAFNMYEDFLKRGVSRETARIILPLNTYTEVVWKLDISNLIKFLRLRDDDHAQWEIRQYAKLVSKAVATHFPLVFAAYTESRASQSFSEAEIAGLVTGDCSHISHSQAGRIHDLREDAELFVS